MSYSDRLRKEDWVVRGVSLDIARGLVEKHHYAKGGSNTRTYLHGLYPKGSFWDAECVGVAWWIPPTKSSAMATYPTDWNGVLSLSRLVMVPGVPKNACTFLLSRDDGARGQLRRQARQAQVRSDPASVPGNTGTVSKDRTNRSCFRDSVGGDTLGKRMCHPLESPASG